MSAARRWAIGLISGTSLDGVDAALIELRGSLEKPRVLLGAFGTFPYPPGLARRLLEMANGARTTAGELSALNFAVGTQFARAALVVCRRGGVGVGEVTVIGSHGQTVFHQGSQVRRASGPYRPASTLQIGEPALIAEAARVPVVADFRVADMAAGGQGAPLVPLVDYLLLSDAREGRIALNLGGIANVTVLPPGARAGDVWGFDTGPGNMVMDELVRHFTHGRTAFDKDGRRAAEGRVIEPLLDRLLRLPFFRRPPPKSAGREQFGDEFMRQYFLARRRFKAEDLISTATELTARSLSQALRRFVFGKVKVSRMIVSGGGAHNDFLLQRLRALLPDIELCPSSKYGIPVDAKEAIAFALLADRTFHGLPGNLPAVTGACRAVLLGKIVPAGRQRAVVQAKNSPKCR